MRNVSVLATVAAALLACSSGGGGGATGACTAAYASCTSGAGCCSGTCVTGICAPGGSGARCTTTNDCQYGLTCKAGVCVAGATCRDVSDVCSSAQECCSGRCGASGACVAETPPVANAGADRTAPYRSTVALDGTASSDPDGDPLTYAWTLQPPASSAAALSSATSATPTFYADVAGVYAATLIVSDGHSTSSSTVHVTAQNYPPVARAGANAIVPKTVPVTLDASGSTDPNGDVLSFSWTLSSVPAGSAAALANASFANATFTPDLAGAYVATVTVSDGSLSGTASVTITAIDTAPVANAGGPQAANVGNPVALDGTKSADADHDPLTYLWTMTARPPASAATLSGATTATPTFTPDVEGAYAFSLAVSDGTNTSAASTVTVTAYHRIAALSHDVVDAEYSAALERIVMVSGTPSSALYVYDPGTGAEQSVALSKLPTAVSVSPDGKSAVVGHDAMLSLVDLTSATRTKELPVPITVGDVVLGTGFAYGFPAGGAQWTYVYTVNLSTGAVTTSSGNSIYGGTIAKLHPSGAALYGADNGLSPDNLENYQIAKNGIASYGWPSPYWGDHPFCGNLWMSQDGARIFTACGNVFAATPTVRCVGTTACGLGTGTPSDMVYMGALQGLAHVLHASDASTVKQLAVVQGDSNWWDTTVTSDTVLESFDDTYLTPIAGSTVTLPQWAGPGAGYVTHGRFVFWRSDATKRFAIVQGDPGTPVAASFGVVTY